MLLARRGFDADKVAQTLNTINITHAFEPLAPLEDTDVEGYLKNEHELTVIRAIEETRMQTLASFEEKTQRRLKSRWQHTKQALMDALGHRPTLSSFANSEDAKRTQVLQPVPEHHPAQERMHAYAECCVRVNDARLAKKSVPVAKLFQEAAEKVHSRADPLSLSWELLSFIMNEPAMLQANSKGKAKETVLATPSRMYPSLSTEGATSAQANERKFANSYLKHAYNDHDAIATRQEFANGAKQWLETYFRRFLDENILRMTRPKQSVQSFGGSLSGTPKLDDARLRARIEKMTVIEKTKMWTRDLLMYHGSQSTWEQIDGVPFWVTVFYLLRCGCDREALEYCHYYQNYLAKTEPRFLDYLSSWVGSDDRVLAPKQRSEMMHEFNTRIRDGAMRNANTTSQHPVSIVSSMGPAPVDPYKYLVYRLISRVGLEDTSIPHAVIRSLAGGILGWEDDLWFQLSLVRESELSSTSTQDASLRERFTLHDLYHRYITNVNIDQWTANGQQPLRFFKILLMCGRFEEAIEYLWRLSTRIANQETRQFYEIDTVHFAIVMAFYGVLRLPPVISDIDLDIASASETQVQGIGKLKQVEINLARLIQIYTRSLFSRTSFPKQAMHYYFFFFLYKDQLTGSQNSKAAVEIRRVGTDAIINLVLETGLIEDFFGSLNANGGTIQDSIRNPGFLDTYLQLIGITGWPEFKDQIIRPAADRAERRAVSASQKAQFEGMEMSDASLQENNALLLYNLAEEYNTVLDILSRRASDALSQTNMVGLSDAVLASVRRETLPLAETLAPQYDGLLDRLVKMEELILPVIEFYSSQPYISPRLDASRKKTIHAFVQLLRFFQSVVSIVQHFLLGNAMSSSSVGGYGKQIGSGVRVNLASPRRGEMLALADPATGLAIIEEAGFIPPISASQRESTPRHHDSSLRGEIDFGRVSAKAESLYREHTESVLKHLPEILLGVEMLIFIGWTESRMHARSSGVFGMDFTQQSRQITVFMSVIGNWFKFSPEMRRRIVEMDEIVTA